MKTTQQEANGLDVLQIRKNELAKSAENSRSISTRCSAMIAVESPSYISIHYSGFEKIGSIGIDHVQGALFSPEFLMQLGKELNRIGAQYASIAIRSENDLEAVKRQLLALGKTTNESNGE